MHAKGEEVLKLRFTNLPSQNIRKIARFIAYFWLLYSQIWIIFAVVFNFTHSERTLYVALLIFVVLNIGIMLFAWQKIRNLSKVKPKYEKHNT
ncbi:MAG: hypothetical protein NZ519_08095 [Bacteroidia bacterium]|nr:hypothetical protein [Bacteroidia bacterium]MDW8301487.1 hypothetical protein [Bacteroidia bacterium]